jgi:PTS system ascorbate-specific IIA component
VASHVYPECGASLAVVDVDPGQSQDDVRDVLRRKLEWLGSGEVLIATDVFGATPCNAARDIAREFGDRVRVVAGANVPMLWRTLCYREATLADVLERSLVGASQGVMHVAASSAQNQGPVIPRHDPQRRHDQQ